jgi:hypothetical protein
MIIDLTCYPTGEPDAPKNRAQEEIVSLTQMLADTAPLGWPPLKLFVDSDGHLRAANFASAVLLFVRVTGGEDLPDMPFLAELDAGWVAWRNYIVVWDKELERLRITELGKGDAPVS